MIKGRQTTVRVVSFEALPNASMIITPPPFTRFPGIWRMAFENGEEKTKHKMPKSFRVGRLKLVEEKA
jgi:hypothetical protein